ncbi:L7Ae/L30e/S12e/Gadd45 family ribosomal protein [Cellulosilyticum sp. I15G10I2]|uniref:L7Ae/L30e/S12e/Gadd45 family ribosomal protein n=1 Tax=Cellulosilyticum sp. I15G10I2 TaxID=1892843 RepID=UPI001FA7FC77|nr:ribosomal L7Ae/L30e/S12e/Gadd45 family protein [Cellulosilyticum sp. I15G10I2]
MIGLCQKARMLVAGEFAAKQAVLEKTALLVIVAADASNNTKKLFKDKCSYRKISCVEWSTKEKLGKILGKEERAVIAIINEGFANKISEMLSCME